MTGKAIFLFNLTRIMPDPWLKAGYECWIYDGQHPDGIHRDPEEPNLVRVGRMFDAENTEGEALRIAEEVGPGVEFVASFAECTYLTTTGARWFYHPEDKHLPTAERRPHPLYPNRLADMEKAVKLAKMVRDVALFCTVTNGTSDGQKEVPWMLENPAVSKLNTKWRRPDHTFDPYNYGGYLPENDQHPLYPQIYPPRDGYDKKTGIWCGGGFRMPERMSVPSIGHNPGWAKAGGKSTRTKNIRSATPRGFARAVYIANAPF